VSLSALARLEELSLYLALGLGAALENIIPPVPADTFVILGGVFAARGTLHPGWVFVSTWLCNVLAAMGVYWAGYHYGEPFFQGGIGRWLLKPNQLAAVARFYGRWGVPAIFLTRFLPGLRAVVPVFAGVTHQRPLPVLIPLLVASAIWYGALVWLGLTAGQNLDEVLAWVRGLMRVGARFTSSSSRIF
jgi:membrane protein DedA with SNARE-associated domain